MSELAWGTIYKVNDTVLRGRNKPPVTLSLTHVDWYNYICLLLSAKFEGRDGCHWTALLESKLLVLVLDLRLQAVSDDRSRGLGLDKSIESWLEETHLLSLALVEWLADISVEQDLLSLLLIPVVSKVVTEV